MFSIRIFAAAALAASSLIACSDDPQEDTSSDTPGSHDTIEVAGEWTSPFGGFERISNTRWDTFAEDNSLSFGQLVTSFDNEARSAITQNPADAEFGANTFNRIVWTQPTTDGFAYCTVAFGLESAEEAQAAPSLADPSDLANGCGGFAWTALEVREAN